jgi:DNA polymerase
MYQGSTGADQNGVLWTWGCLRRNLPEIVQRWRDANKRIRYLWYAMEAAAVSGTDRRSCRGVQNSGWRGRLTQHGQTSLHSVTQRAQAAITDPSLGVNSGARSNMYKGMDHTTKKWNRSKPTAQLLKT